MKLIKFKLTRLNSAAKFDKQIFFNWLIADYNIVNQVCSNREYNNVSNRFYLTQFHENIFKNVMGSYDII